MAGTQVYQPLGENHPDTETVSCLVTYDTGVPSVVSGLGISSVSDDGTGLFTLTFAMNFAYLVGVGHTMLRASAAGGSCEVVAVDASARTIQMRVCNAAGSAADPSDADGVYLVFKLQRTALPVT